MKKLCFLAGVLLATALLWPGMQREKDPGKVEVKHAEKVEARGSGWRDGSLRSSLLNRLSVETGAFRQWTGEYVAAAPGERAGMMEGGKGLARAHRSRMKDLIASDPRRALEEALPVVLRQELPEAITSLLEERVSARGYYAVLGRSPLKGESEGVVRTFLTGDGHQYEARVYGRRVRQMTTMNAPVFGVALDGLLAVHEDPLRPLEPGERLRPDVPVVDTCPVSGKSTEYPEQIGLETPAVEIGGEVHLLCSGGHIQALREAVIAEEGGTGGPSKPAWPGAVTRSMGPKSVLFMRVTFPDHATDPQQEKDAYDMMKQANDFFIENSHGRLYLLTTVTPLLMMPKPEAWYVANDTPTADYVLSDARAAALAAGFDYDAYELDAVRYNGASGGFTGQASVGARGVWLKSSNAGVACHEFGHNFGLWHANLWSTSGDSAIGSGYNSEYGNTFDSMGSANGGIYFFNAGHQNLLSWIPDENVTRVTRSGLYRVVQYDQGRLDPASRYLLTIKKDAERDYWCEFRQKWNGINRWLTDGVPLSWGPWGDASGAGTAYGSNGGSQLLDTTPGSPDGKDDSALVIGRTFADTGAQIYITPVGKAGTVPESMDVVVNKGMFPGNLPPSLTLTAGAAAVAVNGTVTFSATAIDPNGDALAYAWDWGDRTFGPNAAVASRSWGAAGIYTVRCEVSDMRGGTRSALAVVTVGAPAQFIVRGRVLASTGEPLAGVRVHNGLTAAAWRGSYSDSEGNYVISGLAAGNYTMGAVAFTHMFTPVFTNPLTIYADVTAADFTATARAAVALSLPDDSCKEGGDGATLRFTRIAATSAGAIDVRVFAGGSAGISDFDFTPVETYDLSTYRFTIPAGQPSLDVVISAFDDSIAEGPEQMTFHLLDGMGYIPSGAEDVTLTINDNDTALPVAGITAVDDTAAEGGDGATVRLSRTGAVDGPLTVTLARGGTATAGVDYTGINTAVTIPAGQAFIDLPLTVSQDVVTEGTETAVFTVSSTSGWIAAPQQSTATVQIFDDDIPVVTVTAADNAASEAGGDPAVFVITRAGDFTTPLTVDYALGGTAQHGTDYLPLSSSVTIPAGQANASIVIVPVDDTIGELPQTVSLQLRSSSGYLTGAAFSATATIADNDVPHVMITVSDGSCDESGGTGKFKIQSYGTGAGNVTVNYAVTGTALSGSDYTALPGTVSVPRSGFVEVVITPLQDSIREDAESVVLTLLPDAAYTLSLENTATLFLADDDQPTVSVTAGHADRIENAGPARFYFSCNGAPATALTVGCTLTGTATAGSDYAVQPGFVIIPAGSTGVWLDVPLFEDGMPEGAESIICTLAPGAYGVQQVAATVWLNDPESTGLPVVSFAASGSSRSESAGAIIVPVRLFTASTNEVRVDYALDGGLAFNGADYNAAGGTVIFAPGETTRDITLTLREDVFIEPEETLSLRLVRATSARITSPSTYTLTILDNDTPPPPLIGFAVAASSAAEGSGTPAQALVFLSAAQTVPCSVDWVVTGGTAAANDMAGMNGTLTFLPGETAKPVPLLLVDDPAIEGPETVMLSLSNPTNSCRLAPLISHTLTIEDNDDLVITLTSSDTSAAEEGVNPAQITVTRASANLSGAVTVQLSTGGTAMAGTDYAAIAPEVTIPAGQTSANLMLTPIDDAVFDPGESVIVSISSSPFYTIGTPSSATLTISDNETGVSVAATDADAAEPADSGTFTLTRTGPAAGEIRVFLNTGGSASAGDFSALPGSVLFLAGQMTREVAVTPVDDFLAEPDKTVMITVEPGAGYVPVGVPAVIAIHDDDSNAAPQISILSPAGGTAFIPKGPGLILEAVVTDDGHPYPSAPVMSGWGLISGPGTVTFGDSAAASTTAQFSAPGQYLLRLLASDAELTAMADVSVFVLSDTLTGVNVGTASALTGLAGGGNTWALTGAGNGLSGMADGFYFAHRQMSGDFTITARVASISPGAGNAARCGVMVRSALTPGARHAGMMATPDRSSFVWRTLDGVPGAASNTNQSPAVPRYVRLTRTGNLFAAASSTDGNTWTGQGTAQTINMPDPVYAGLAVTSANDSVTVTAAFDGFSLTHAGNTGPFVSAGPHFTSGPNALLEGVVTDDAGTPPVQWMKASGPGSVILPAAASGSAIFSSGGYYTLRLVADDGFIRTFDETVVTVSSPFTEWCMQHFGASAADPQVGGPRADPDRDGLENLAEYALSSNPSRPDSTVAPLSSRGTNTLRMTWRQSTSAVDVVIEPQWSGDMEGWTSAGLTVETVNSGEGWIEKRAVLNTAGLTRAGIRLRVTMP